MPTQILINKRPNETRVAIIENGSLIDILSESRHKKGMVGSIYRGKVSRILPGMQAAFVDIGLDRAAFLYVGDVRDFSKGPVTIEMGSDALESEVEDVMYVKDKSFSPQVPIQNLLKDGQEIMVQVAKDPLGTKGARITTHITLPGRFVVYMPTVSHFGISRRIESTSERERLREVVNQNKPKTGGLILRTAAEGASAEDIKADIIYLERLFQSIDSQYQTKRKVSLVHSEQSVEIRAVRDFINDDVTHVIVDNKESREEIRAFIHQFLPEYRGQVDEYTDSTPLFDKYDVDFELSRSLGRKVWLKSGGYIVFDEAEALVVIDINTGSFVGKKDFEETILKTNLEAVKEICAQLRIRNCGGIIIIDFIDMLKPSSREQVMNSLQEELKKDRAKTNVMPMSELGLVEMTRKRVRPSLVKTLCEPCSYCDGKGYIKSKSYIGNEIFREAERESSRTSGDAIIVHCHPDIASWIFDEESEMIEFLETRLDRRIIIKVEPTYHVEQFDLYSESLQP
jgi:ribonuclease G